MSSTSCWSTPQWRRGPRCEPACRYRRHPPSRPGDRRDRPRRHGRAGPDHGSGRRRRRRPPVPRGPGGPGSGRRPAPPRRGAAHYAVLRPAGLGRLRVPHRGPDDGRGVPDPRRRGQRLGLRPDGPRRLVAGRPSRRAPGSPGGGQPRAGRASGRRPSAPARCAAAGLPNHIRRAWGPGWALVGDAAMHRDPVTGHGITDAFRDAELMSRALDGVLRGELAEAVAGHTYEALRHDLVPPSSTPTVRMSQYPPVDEFVAQQRRSTEAIEAEARFLSELPAWPALLAAAARRTGQPCTRTPPPRPRPCSSIGGEPPAAWRSASAVGPLVGPGRPSCSSARSPHHNRQTAINNQGEPNHDRHREPPRSATGSTPPPCSPPSTPCRAAASSRSSSSARRNRLGERTHSRGDHRRLLRCRHEHAHAVHVSRRITPPCWSETTTGRARRVPALRPGRLHDRRHRQHRRRARREAHR